MQRIHCDLCDEIITIACTHLRGEPVSEINDIHNTFRVEFKRTTEPLALNRSQVDADLCVSCARQILADIYQANFTQPTKEHT